MVRQKAPNARALYGHKYLWIHDSIAQRQLLMRTLTSCLASNSIYLLQYGDFLDEMYFERFFYYLLCLHKKNRFWLNRSRESCQNELSVLTFDENGLSYIPKASDMPMTKKKKEYIHIFNHTLFRLINRRCLVLTDLFDDKNRD